VHNGSIKHGGVKMQQQTERDLLQQQTPEVVAIFHICGVMREAKVNQTLPAVLLQVEQ